MDACGNISNATSSVYIARKTKIRHYTGSAKNPYNDICIDYPAVAAHMANHSMYGNPSQHDYIINPCGSTQRMILGSTTPVDLQVAPNPNNGAFKVMLPVMETEASMMITDVQGRLVQKTAIAPDTKSVDVNISNFGKGIYFITVVDGDHTFRTKFVSE
jgi:hypothetical protein